jgi:hypothetical protein
MGIIDAMIKGAIAVDIKKGGAFDTTISPKIAAFMIRCDY